jgi:hypothetical protein
MAVPPRLNGVLEEGAVKIYEVPSPVQEKHLLDFQVGKIARSYEVLDDKPVSHRGSGINCWDGLGVFHHFLLLGMSARKRSGGSRVQLKNLFILP